MALELKGGVVDTVTVKGVDTSTSNGAGVAVDGATSTLNGIDAVTSTLTDDYVCTTIGVSVTLTSFKDKLLESNPMDFAPTIEQEDMLYTTNAMEAKEPMHDPEVNGGGVIKIFFSSEDRQRIYETWKYSIIIKLVGKCMLHHYLKRKIQDLWKPTEDFLLIGLGEDYYIIKFTKKENMDKAIHLGSWFINGHFLSISRWKPNFVARNEKLTTSAVWIRLHQLPMEFYDGKILEKIGNAIGRLLKIDTCTSTTLRGRYARICVEIPLEIPV
ncbi:uncharacterized protein [Nicotiana sylvestris]|uniref:uncharacterized protein n=1 Tax=Nicotiana sylvestris TaxID=4096 RepID=UPI00388CCBB6